MNERGLTLIEVLVTLVVLSVAVLATAALQARVIADTQNANLRGLVALQATALANRLHANRAFWGPDGPGAGNVALRIDQGSVHDPDGLLDALHPPCATPPSTAQARCTPAQMAAMDVQDWAREASAWIPALQAQLRCRGASGAGTQCALTLRWTERRITTRLSPAADSPGTGGPRSYTLHITP